MKKTIQDIPITPNMLDLIQFIKDSENDFIIVSNSNSLFIQWIIERYDTLKNVKQIYTNPLSFDENGVAKIGVAHEHNCSKCDFN